MCNVTIALHIATIMTVQSVNNQYVGQAGAITSCILFMPYFVTRLSDSIWILSDIILLAWEKTTTVYVIIHCKIVLIIFCWILIGKKRWQLSSLLGGMERWLPHWSLGKVTFRFLECYFWMIIFKPANRVLEINVVVRIISKSTLNMLNKIMAQCDQATSDYQNLCSPRFSMPYNDPTPQC